MADFERLLRGARPRTLIDYADIQQPDYYSPSPAEMVAERFTQAAQTASDAYLQSRRDNMKFQLEMEDRNIKREQVTAQTRLAERQIVNEEDSITSEMLDKINPSDRSSMRNAIMSIKDPAKRDMYTNYYNNTVIPTLARKEFIETQLADKNVNQILKHSFTITVGDTEKEVTGRQLLDEYAGMVTRKDGNLINLDYDSGVQLKIEEYNKNRNMYDLISSDTLTKPLNKGGFGLSESDLAIFEGTIGSDKLESTLTDMIKVKYAGKFETDAAKNQLSLAVKQASALETAIRNNTAEINANTARINSDTTPENEVRTLQQRNRELENDNKTKRTQADTIVNNLVGRAEPKAKIIKKETIDGVDYNVTYSGTGEVVSREPVTKQSEAERIAAENARIKAEQEAAEAERIKAEEAARAAEAKRLADEQAAAAAAAKAGTGDDSVTTTPSGLTYSNVYQPDAPDKVVETVPDTVLDTVAKENLNWLEERTLPLQGKILKPKALSTEQLKRILNSGELDASQYKYVVDYLIKQKKTGEAINPKSKGFQNLINIIYKD